MIWRWRESLRQRKYEEQRDFKQLFKVKVCVTSFSFVGSAAMQHNDDKLSFATFSGLLICNNEPLRIGCMTLINAIISTPEDLDFRLHLRNEIMRTGLVDVMEVGGD